MEQLDRRLILGAAGLAGVAAMSRLAMAGPLDPPAGPVTPTGKSVQEIYDKVARTDMGLAEPRTPVQSLPGSATAQYVISQPGSYYLTGNIQGVAGKHGIEISADGVTLDLGGFILTGVPGSACGVFSSARGTVVCNGTVSSWGASGVRLDDSDRGGSASQVRKIFVFDNEGNGLRIGSGSVVQSCVADRNRGFGISVGTSGLVEGCLVRRSREAGGVFAFNRSIVRDCVSENNTFEGIRADFENHVHGNCCSNNGTVNISGGQGARVTDNSCHGGPVGISAGPRTSVINNTCENVTVAFDINGPNAMVAQNTAVASATPFDIAADNSHGPIVNVTGVGVITSVPNSSHPWANFVH